MDISFFLRQCRGQAPRFHPDDAAIGFEDAAALSYADIEQRSLRYAGALRELGVVAGDRVGILLYNRVEYWLAYFAITRLGAIAVRLNFRLAPEELVYALTDSGASVLLSEIDLLKKLEGCRDQVDIRCFVGFAGLEPGSRAEPLPDWAIDAAALEQGAALEPGLPLPAPDDPAMLMYTSGTTGRPKGALWAHGTTTWWAAMQVVEWGFSPATVTMITGPMYHIGGLENYALPTLAAGGRVVILRSGNFGIRRTLEIASRQKVTDILLFPTMIYQMLEDERIDEIDLSTIRRVFSGGDPLLPSAIRQMQERFGWMDIVQVYGLTEGTPIVACGGPGQSLSQPAAVGRAFPFSEISIRNDDGLPVATGDVGEIWTRSPANALGYWNKPEATAETFVDGWCRTGDLGAVQDGALHIAGRKKDMVRSGGENIYPSEIEDLLLRHPAISEAAVIGIPDPLYLEAVCAVVVPRNGATISESEVIAYCGDHLASYKKPKRVVFLEKLPRTPSHKIIKSELRQKYRA